MGAEWAEKYPSEIFSDAPQNFARTHTRQARRKFCLEILQCLRDEIFLAGIFRAKIHGGFTTAKWWGMMTPHNSGRLLYIFRHQLWEQARDAEEKTDQFHEREPRRNDVGRRRTRPSGEPQSTRRVDAARTLRQMYGLRRVGHSLSRSFLLTC